MEPTSRDGDDVAPAGSPAEARAEEWDWDALNAELRPRLLNAGVNRFGLTREEAEDIIQSVFLRTVDLNPRVRDPIGYLKNAFRFGCINSLKALGRMPPHLTDVEVPDDRMRRAISQREAAELLRRAFHLVDATCRKLLRQYYLQSSTLAVSARVIGYSANAIWRKVQSCLRKMRACLT